MLATGLLCPTGWPALDESGGEKTGMAVPYLEKCGLGSAASDALSTTRIPLRSTMGYSIREAPVFFRYSW